MFAIKVYFLKQCMKILLEFKITLLKSSFPCIFTVVSHRTKKCRSYVATVQLIIGLMTSACESDVRFFFLMPVDQKFALQGSAGGQAQLSSDTSAFLPPPAAMVGHVAVKLPDFGSRTLTSGSARRTLFFIAPKLLSVLPSTTTAWLACPLVISMVKELAYHVRTGTVGDLYKQPEAKLTSSYQKNLGQ